MRTYRLVGSLLSVIVTATVVLFPLGVTVLAEESTPAPTEQSAVVEEVTPVTDTITTPLPVAEPNPQPTADVTGPTSPTGPAADSYTYNSTTGLWENSKYTWDPVSKQTAPKQAPNYSYNPSTGMWDTTEWVYDAPSGAYKPQTVSVPPQQLPQNAMLAATGPPEQSSIDEPAAFAAKSVDGNGTQDDPYILLNSNNQGVFDLFYNASISNNINASATSGNAYVLQNTLGGSATTGDASSYATLINMLQSGWNPNDAVATFNALVSGNVVGDLYIDPSSIGNVQANAVNDLTLHAVNSGSITNNVNLAATSGDAEVSSNTKAGDATTGAAMAMANLINLISSMITSGQSFIGSITIDGNLDGDILLPPGMLDSLLATNTSSTQTNTLTATDTSSQTVTNNLTATATSGQATVSNNTTAGNATTGSATTKVNIINLTGRQVIAKNALLVFVNVFGSWTGLIIDAPAGTTAAMLAGGQSQNTTSATNTATIDNTTDQTITNNVFVTAASGDATVSNNTSAGNATTGDAFAGINIANMTNSSFAMSDWFGVLFINVLGSWIGSFGVNTNAGSPIIAPASNSPPSMTALSSHQPLTFVASATSARGVIARQQPVAPTDTQTESSDSKAPVVLGDTSVPPPSNIARAATVNRNIRWAVAAGTLATILFIISFELRRRASVQNVVA